MPSTRTSLVDFHTDGNLVHGVDDRLAHLLVRDVQDDSVGLRLLAVQHLEARVVLQVSDGRRLEDVRPQHRVERTVEERGLDVGGRVVADDAQLLDVRRAAPVGNVGSEDDEVVVIGVVCVRRATLEHERASAGDGRRAGARDFSVVGGRCDGAPARRARVLRVGVRRGAADERRLLRVEARPRGLLRHFARRGGARCLLIQC